MENTECYVFWFISIILKNKPGYFVLLFLIKYAIKTGQVHVLSLKK